MPLQTGRLSYEDYLNTPEIKQSYDIVDGQMIMAPAPSLEHQTILRDLSFLLHSFVREHRLGWVWFAPLDVIIQREPLRTRQPDLMFVSDERSAILGERVEGGPDLVVEILFPSNTQSYMAGKLADYRQIGVRECWLVSPEAHSVEVLEMGDEGWQRIAIYGLGDSVQSTVLTGLALPVADMFGQAWLGVPENDQDTREGF
jgi:Uma2 family endonuclease